MKPENQTAYYQEHPPKCIGDFAVQPEWLDHVEYDGHGFSGRYPDGLVANLNIVFAVKCQCGNGTHHVIAESRQEEIRYYQNLVIAEKYFLECRACHSRNLFFDPLQYGYNAQTFLMEGISFRDDLENSFASGKYEKATCECPSCHSVIFEVFARFEYSANLFEEPEFEGKEQDLFSWFTGTGRCKTCSTVTMFMDFECA